jgi:flagellin-like protein
MAGKNLKGISPLVAVIMLIAFTLIVAGILAGWATQFAQTQRQAVEFCADARLLLRSGDYNPDTDTLTLVAYNYGRVPLELTILLDYSNITLHPTRAEIYPEDFNITEDSIEALILTGVSNDLEEVNVQSKKCPGASDRLRAIDINGL